MTNDWIAFYHNGKICVDVVLRWAQSTTYPRDSFALTPHHGKVPYALVVEIRAASERREELNP